MVLPPFLTVGGEANTPLGNQTIRSGLSGQWLKTKLSAPLAYSNVQPLTEAGADPFWFWPRACFGWFCQADAPAATAALP